MPRTKFITLALVLITMMPISANASDIIKNPASVVMTQLNIAKKQVMGHLTSETKSQEIVLDGARVKAPDFSESSEKNTKIWFTTKEGKQLKWPFIDLYHSNPETIEPSAGKPTALYMPAPKTYNHYSGNTHSAFKKGLPSSFQNSEEMPYYAALINAPSKKPHQHNIQRNY